MNKALIAAVIGCGTALAAVNASAADIDNPNGIYIGGGYGQFNLDIEDIDDAGAGIESIAESDDNAWKLFVGHRINPFIALELDYVDLGNPGSRFETSGSDGNYRVEIAGFAPYVIGTLPLGPVELFGKLGYYFYDVDLAVDLDSDPDIDSSHSDSNLTYGAGIGLTLFDHLHARVEYEILDLDDAPNSDALWLSAAWRF